MCDKQIVVELPENICTWKKVRTICIDACIVPQIKELWTEGYETLGCCCGHNKCKPSVVIGEGYDNMVIQNIASILSNSDDRVWDILQWKLQSVQPQRY